MSGRAEQLELTLVQDLRAVDQRFRDEEFVSDLYRALASRVWAKDGEEGEVAFSWRRAEEIVNELRDLVNEPALTLRQTGGEGEVSPVVAEELGALGWRSRPLDTSDHEPEHLRQPESKPPGAQPPAGDEEWERTAHAEADAERARRLGA